MVARVFIVSEPHFLRFCTDQPPSFSPETSWRWSDAAPSFARTCVSSTRIQCGTPPPLIMKRFSQSANMLSEGVLRNGVDCTLPSHCGFLRHGIDVIRCAMRWVTWC